MERDARRMKTYSCTGLQVPYFVAVKDPNPVNDLLYVLGLFLIRGKQVSVERVDGDGERVDGVRRESKRGWRESRQG